MQCVHTVATSWTVHAGNRRQFLHKHSTKSPCKSSARKYVIFTASPFKCFMVSIFIPLKQTYSDKSFSSSLSPRVHLLKSSRRRSPRLSARPNTIIKIALVVSATSGQPLMRKFTTRWQPPSGKRPRKVLFC